MNEPGISPSRIVLPLRHALALAALLAFAATLAADGLPAGFDPGAELIVDALSVVRGGDDDGSAIMGKVSLVLDYDSAEAGRREGTRARINVLGTFGDSLSELAGDLQVASNIEAPDDLRIFEAWVEQSLGERVSILAGWNDFNAEFDVTATSAGLLNSSFGVGAELSQVGPSIFPRSYPGLRLRAGEAEGAYVLAGGWYGVPFPVAESCACDEVEGSFGAVEAGWTRAASDRLSSSKLAAGIWRFKARGSELPDEDDAVGGFYGLAEADLPVAGERRLGAFIRAGRALDEARSIREYVAAGLRLAAVARSRPDDEIALGVSVVRLSPEMQSIVGTDRETTWELNWRFQIGEALAIVPDVQYVDSPAGVAGASSAFVAGIRAVVTID